MNRLIFKLILVILCTMGLAVAISLDSGYVFIKYNHFEYEASLWITLGFIASIVFIIWLCFMLLGLVLQLFGKVNPFSSERKQYHGELGLQELAEGNWSAALKRLKSASKGRHISLSYFLGAAQAANELKQYQVSDSFIEKACDYAPKAKVAIGLTFARLLIARQDYNKALNVAKELINIRPNHPLAIQLLYDIYIQQEDWGSIKDILPALRKHKLLPSNTLTRLEQHVGITTLKLSFKNNTEQPVLAIEQLKRTWDSFPANSRENYKILEVYIQCLCSLNGHQEAEQVLQKAIDKNYSTELVYLYGQVVGADNEKQINNAERWLKKHNNDATLLLTLGKLCQRNQLWGKAKEYFEKSAQLSHSPEATLELAGYLAKRGEMEKSNQLFQASLQKLHHSLHTKNSIDNT